MHCGAHATDGCGLPAAWPSETHCRHSYQTLLAPPSAALSILPRSLLGKDKRKRQEKKERVRRESEKRKWEEKVRRESEKRECMCVCHQLTRESYTKARQIEKQTKETTVTESENKRAKKRERENMPSVVTLYRETQKRWLVRQDEKCQTFYCSLASWRHPTVLYCEWIKIEGERSPNKD